MPKFTKKHYEHMAKVLHNNKDTHVLMDNFEEWSTIKQFLELVFMEDNSKFDRNKFHKVCWKS